MSFHDPTLPEKPVTRELRLVQETSVEQGERAADPHDAAPGPLADQFPQRVFLESVGEDVAVGCREFVDEANLGSEKHVAGVGARHGIPRDANHGDFAPEALGDERRDEAASVAPYIDDERLLAELRVKVFYEFVQPVRSHVGHVQITHLAVSRGIDFPDVLLNPVKIIEAGLVCDGFYHHRPAPLGGRLGVQGERHLLIHRVDQGLIDVRHRAGGLAIDGNDVFSLVRVHADLGQRAAGGVVPVLPFENPSDPVVFRVGIAFKLGPEEAGLYAFRFGHVAAADVSVARAQLADHLSDDVGEVGAVVDVG